MRGERIRALEAAFGTVLERHDAAMAFGNRLDQGRPQAGAAGLAIARAFQPDEGLKYPLLVLFRDTRPWSSTRIS